MNITICDLCKKLPNTFTFPVTMYRFEREENWRGVPKNVKEICAECLDKLFNVQDND